MKRLANWLAYLAVRTVVSLVQAVTLDTCHAGARLLARVATDLVRLRRDVVDENIRHAFPHLTESQRRRMARQMWEHLFLMVCEIAHAPRRVHDTNWRQFFSFQGKRELVAYMLDPRPKVLVSGHFGNFELSAYMTSLLGFPGHAIARPLDNPYLDRYVDRFRELQGQYILPKKGSAPQVEAVLQEGGLIALLGDQYAGPKGCWVEFLGRPASCHKAVALLTLTSGAPLVVAYGRRTGGPLQFELGLEGVADPQQPGPELANVKSLTRWYNAMLERVVARAPEQYWWVHRRWKGAPPKRGQQTEPPAQAAPGEDQRKSAA